MAYTRTTWEDSPSTNTPINATRLNNIESGIVNLETSINGGWNPISDTWTYASATTITVPSGAASKYQKGDKIKLTQTTVKYFYVVDVADTLLTITGGNDYTLTNAAITDMYYSHSATPIGFPGSFTFTCTVSAPVGTTAPTYSSNECFFSINGSVVNVSIRLTNTTGGTAGSGTGELRFSLPASSKSLLISGYGIFYEQDIGAIKTIFARYATAALIYSHDVSGNNIIGNDQSSVNRYIGFNLTYPLL